MPLDCKPCKHCDKSHFYHYIYDTQLFFKEALRFDKHMYTQEEIDLIVKVKDFLDRRLEIEANKPPSEYEEDVI